MNINDLTFAINEKLKEMRAKTGLTMDEVSEKTGVSKATLSNIESYRNTPSLPTIGKLSEFYERELSKAPYDIDNIYIKNNDSRCFVKEEIYKYDFEKPFNLNKPLSTAKFKRKSYQYNKHDISKEDRVMIRNTLQLLKNYLDLKYPKCIYEDEE